MTRCVRNGTRLLVVLASLLAVAAVAVGVAGGDHDEPIDEHDIVEVRTVSTTETGELRSTHSYHVGEKIRGLTVSIRSGDQPVGTDGFEPTGEAHTYEWDEQTARPSFEFSIDPAQSTVRDDGLVAADTGEWAMIGTDVLPRTELRPVALESEIDDVEIDWTTEVPETEGVAGTGLLYLGEYDRYQFDTGSDLIVTESANVGGTEQIDEIGAALEQSAKHLSVGVDDPVTAFVVSSPLRRGGFSVASDFWIHEANLPPQLVLYHEFVHTQQQYDRTGAVEWTAEASAEYYAALLALKQGDIEYREFRDLLSRGGEYEDVVLADRDSWAGTDADYEQGALVLAALDSAIRERGDGTLEDVFRTMNEGAEVTDEQFEAIASEAAGRDLAAFFDAYIRSGPPEISIPAPVVYDGPNDGAVPALDPAAVAFDPNGRTTVPVEIENRGSETSLAPQLVTESPATVELLSADGTATEVDGGWVFDHLDSGETRTVSIGIEADTADNATVDLSLEDMSGQTDRAVVSFEQLPAVEATLATPDRTKSRDTVELVADSTVSADRIDRYEFSVGDERISSTDRRLGYRFASPGSYNLSVAVVTVDGRRGSANASITVVEGDDQAETDSTAGTGTDATGAGFGVVVAVNALLFAVFLGRERET